MNFGDLFDSPLKLAIIALLIIVLFGSKKLPGAARSLGQSMRILKREVQGLHEDETAPGAPAQGPAAGIPAASIPAVGIPAASTPAASTPATGYPQAEVAAVPQPDQQAQIDALQQQVRDLQRAAAMNPVPAADVPRTQQPS